MVTGQVWMVFVDGNGGALGVNLSMMVVVFYTEAC